MAAERSLPARTAGHQTLAVRRMAVHAEEYWEYRPEQTVMTRDGILGTVKSVADGPLPGLEEYHVELVSGFGGGTYTASQLSLPPSSVASRSSAAHDYPELGRILTDKPDPAKIHTYAAKNDDDEDDSKPWEKNDSKDDDDSKDSESDGDDSDAKDSGKDSGKDEKKDDGGDDKDNPFAKFTSLLVAAATDADFRMHVTAAWRDVVAKAKRIRAGGGVRVTLATDGLVVGEIKGDTEVYESGLQRLPGRMAAQSWSCGCKWGAYHWGADDDFSRFAGRMCSHALALQYEAQSRGMFGRDIGADDEKPSWVPRSVVVKYDIDERRNEFGRASKLQQAPPAEEPVRMVARAAVSAGWDRDEVIVALAACGITATAAVNSPFGEPGGEGYEQPRMPGATSPHTMGENPASAGPLVASDPAGWSHALPGTLDDRLGAVTAEAAMFEPGGPQAVAHDTPQGALPSTDGDTAAIPSDDDALSPAMGMRKRALKDFSPSERRALINEGEDVRARNLDSLQIEGTHYAAIEDSLASDSLDLHWLS